MLDGLGDIYVNRSQAPEYDREAEPTVNLTVIAEDEGGKEAQASVIITVLDKNDNDPKFLKTVYEFEIFQVCFRRPCFYSAYVPSGIKRLTRFSSGDNIH